MKSCLHLLARWPHVVSDFLCFIIFTVLKIVNSVDCERLNFSVTSFVLFFPSSTASRTLTGAVCLKPFYFCPLIGWWLFLSQTKLHLYFTTDSLRTGTKSSLWSFVSYTPRFSVDWALHEPHSHVCFTLSVTPGILAKFSSNGFFKIYFGHEF